eukprot:jgi/Mesvir1/13299/Mv08588-RA.1
MRDPFLTCCGHSFCYGCISQHLRSRSNCPTCQQFCSSDKIFPNVLAQKLVCRELEAQKSGLPESTGQQLKAAISEGADLTVEDVRALMSQLRDKERQLCDDADQHRTRMLLKFLRWSRAHKQEAMDETREAIAWLESDLQAVRANLYQIRLQRQPNAATTSCALPPGTSNANNAPAGGNAGTDASANCNGSNVSVGLMAATNQQQASSLPNATSAGWGRGNHALVRGTSLSSLSAHEIRQSQQARSIGGGGGHHDNASPGQSGRSSQSAGQVASSSKRPARGDRGRSTGSGGALEGGSQGQYAGGGEALGLEGCGRGGAQAACSLGVMAHKRRAEDKSGAVLRTPAGPDAPGAMLPALEAGPPASAAMLTSGSLPPSSSSAGAESSPAQAGVRPSPMESVTAAESTPGLAASSAIVMLRGPGSAGVSHAASSGPVGAGIGAGSNGPAALAAIALSGNANANAGNSSVKGYLYPEPLEEVRNTVAAITHGASMKVVADLRHSEQSSLAHIVSSIEFDCDNEYFGIAGVSKRIMVFSLADVVAPRDPSAGVHVPVANIPTHSKLSCLSWNHSHKQLLASSDYDGVVTLWDATTSRPVMEFEEHEKRVWSIDFSRLRHKLLLSGSDDGKVKLWSLDQESSVQTIDTKANICCVEFNPANEYHFVAGSADHHIHSYDIRMAAEPLHSFAGHRKAVSYVSFLNANELVSASTDSTLRLWDVADNCLARTMRSHINEKNFVGLSVNKDYIACGSETSEVFVYYRSLQKPLTSFKLTAGDECDGRENDQSHFISAVCWNSDDLSMLAANSQGIIKVLKLTT